MLDYNAAIDRYGGKSLWDRLDCIVINVKKLGGAIPVIKGIGRTFQQFGHIHLYPKQKRVVFFDQQQKLMGEFQFGKIIENNKVTSENHRPTFSGFKKWRFWNNADAMYFFGAALTTYSGVPFIFPELKTSVQKWRDGLAVMVVFPEPVHTHCAKQTFYFNKEGLLQRHDYQAEVISKLAIGSHFTSDFKEIKSLPIPRKRIVYVRLFKWVLPIPVLHAEIEPIDVIFK